MTTHPNCKINLGLHVTERRPDGYHNLESIFLPVPDLCDQLTIEPLPDDTSNQQCIFTQDGITIDGNAEDNLCMKAYRLLKNEHPEQVKSVRIHLGKHIPFGAGLGGGSADASFTLLMLNDIFDLHLTTQQLCRYAARLGADCPFFIHNHAAYVTGIGDKMEPLDFSLSNLGLRVVIRKPDESVATREAYANLVPRNRRTDNFANVNLKEALSAPVSQWIDLFVNDFETSVFPSHPAIARLKQQFYDEGAIYASMTGSGSAVFGLFQD